MSDAANKETFKPDETHHRRGDFPVVNFGVTFGLGGQNPTNLNVGGHERAAAELLRNPHVNRIATFARGEPSLLVLALKMTNSLQSHSILCPLVSSHISLVQEPPRQTLGEITPSASEFQEKYLHGGRIQRWTPGLDAPPSRLQKSPLRHVRHSSVG